MKKSLKISLGIFGIVSIGAVSLFTVISCSSKSNDAKVNNQSSSTSSSSSSSNESYVPYSTLFSQSILENPTTKNTSWTYDEALTYWTTYFKNEIAKEGFENVVTNDLYAVKNYELQQAKNYYAGATSIDISFSSLTFNSNNTFDFILNCKLIYIQDNDAQFSYNFTQVYDNATILPSIVAETNDNNQITSYFGGWWINGLTYYSYSTNNPTISSNWTDQDFTNTQSLIWPGITLENYKSKINKVWTLINNKNSSYTFSNNTNLLSTSTMLSQNNSDTITTNFQVYSTFGYEDNYGINFGLVSDIPSSITN